jgi:hypothetical protein
VATRKVKRFNEGGEGFGYGEGAGAAQGSGMGGFGSSGLGEGLGRGIGPGSEAMALGDYATEADYAAQDRSYMDANAANAALTAQENNMQNAQNLAASSQSARDRNALSAAQDNYASGVAAVASALGGYGNGNKGGGLGAGPNDNANDRAKGGMIKKYAKGGSVSSASSRGDGIAQRGKTKGRMC